MGYFRDLREYISYLEQNDLLFRVTEMINKDTELMPLVRWQFRGLPESQRKAWLFENLTDSRGRMYKGSKVAVGLLGGSTEIFARSMMCDRNEIWDKYALGLLNPIEPELVSTGPVQEEVHYGEELTKDGGGLDEFPIPISTPGYDAAAYFTSPYWITKDPETGQRNTGTYRAMVKGRNKTGIMTHGAQHIGIHMRKAKEKGLRSLEAALVVGAVPVVGHLSASKIPYGQDELAVAGGIIGEPIPLVKCKTIDIEVPATAEIVLEGEIDVEYLEPEGPFGEYTGYMAERALNHYFMIKCITHRRDPIYQAFISQMPPSESTKLRQLNYESTMYKYLKYDTGISSVKRVSFHEMGGSVQWIVIQMKKEHPAQPWQALNAAVAFDAQNGKYVVVVDDDVDPSDPESIMWALSFRTQPHLDVRITVGKSSPLDPSAAPPGTSTDERRFPGRTGTSAILIDATRKWDYPPISLPTREYMENARNIWERIGLPTLTPRIPWYGYNLGHWDAELAEEARDAVAGNYYRTGEKLSNNKVKYELKGGGRTSE